MKLNYEGLAKLATDQDNVVTRKQLRALGFSDKQIGAMVRRKLWVQLQRGVYLLAPGPATWRQRARAAQWAGGRPVGLDAGSALLWLGFDGPEENETIELCLVSGKGLPCPRDAIVRRPKRRISMRTWDGVQVVRVEDALLSFAALSADRRALEVAVESVLLAHKSTERKIWRTIERNSRKGVRGVALLRRVMDCRPEGKPSRSILELEVLDVIRKSDLPMPQRNVDVVDADGRTREIDLCYLPQKGAVEVDSRRWHSTATQVAEDRRRQHALEAVGFEFVRVTWRDVLERPEWIIEEIRRLLLRVVAA
jgi:REase_MTES_1575/Transcriptional regulator, AbiEi antitoxin